MKVDVQVPGETLHAHSKELAGETHADVYMTLDDAFDVIVRKLQRSPIDYVTGVLGHREHCGFRRS